MDHIVPVLFKDDVDTKGLPMKRIALEVIVEASIKVPATLPAPGDVTGHSAISVPTTSTERKRPDTYLRVDSILAATPQGNPKTAVIDERLRLTTKREQRLEAAELEVTAANSYLPEGETWSEGGPNPTLWTHHAGIMGLEYKVRTVHCSC